MSTEIKPKMVDGDAYCKWPNRDCPSCYNKRVCTIMSERGASASLPPNGTATCWPYYRAALAESRGEVERLKEEWDNLNNMRIDEKNRAHDAVKRAETAETALDAVREVLDAIVTTAKVYEDSGDLKYAPALLGHLTRARALLGDSGEGER